jgi:hypothetical protein
MVQLKRQHDVALNYIPEVGSSLFEVRALGEETLSTRDFADDDTVFVPEVLGALKGSSGVLGH